MRHPELDYSNPQSFSTKQRIMLVLIPAVIAVVFRIIMVTCRVRVIGKENLTRVLEAHGCATVGCWHEGLAIVLWCFRGSGYHTLASYSYDGELAARVSEWFGMHALRGSSSRGGFQALSNLRKAVKLGVTAGFTLDGPKGPRRVAKPGIALLAAQSGLPVVPIALEATPCWRLKSWDRMCIPKPFSTVRLVYGTPIASPSKVRAAELERFRLEIEESLNGLHEST